MSELTPGASLAWRVAAAEAGEGRHAQIECGHLLLGICSLEKVVALPEAPEPAEQAVVLEENARVQAILSRLGLDAARLRRALRSRLGVGLHAPDGTAISRSPSCKEAFRRAADLAADGDVGAVYLMAALLEEPDGTLEAVLGGTGVGAAALREQAWAELGLPRELATERLAGEARRPRLPDLEPFLRSRLVGQDEAIARVCQRLRLAQSVTRERPGPLAVLLFLGPRGVGKTETARLLAEFVLGSASGASYLDMSRYREERSLCKLLGALPGLAGHGEEGQLAGCLRSKPYSVVLLDEVEKAHPRLLELLLPIFAEGRFTGAEGRVADARHAIFVMTSNLGAETAGKRAGFGGGEGEVDRLRTAALDEARRFFRAEFLGRVDDPIVFRPLAEADVMRILRARLQEIAERLGKQHDVRLAVEAEAERFIASAGYSPALGLRELSRTVERLVQAPLRSLQLSGKLAKHPAWRIAYDEGGIYILPA